jgi:hypothetical protein
MKSWKLLPLLTAFALVMAAQANAQTTDVDGSFDNLSTGNQKIATVLFEAQDGSNDPPLTLDHIAAMKQDGTGWGRLFQDLQASGDIPMDVKNLGELVSGRYQATGDVTTESGTDTGGTDTGGTDTVTKESGTKTQGGSAPGAAASGRGKGTIVITTAGGGQIVVQRGNRRGQGAGAGAAGTAKTTGGGAGQGHGKGGSRSITVTTAGGGSVSAGGGKANGLGHGKGGVTVSTAGGGSLGGGQGGVKVAGGGSQGRGAGPKK